MTVTSTSTKVSYEGNDTTTLFAVPFRVIEENDLFLEVQNDTTEVITELTYGVDFTVEITDESANVTTTDPVAIGETLTICRITDTDQTVEYVTFQQFVADVLETSLDKLTCRIQELDYGLSLVSPESLADYQLLSEKGLADGYASLNAFGKVPEEHLPDAINEVKEYADLASFPAVGVIATIYLAVDTNFTYRWSGTSYIAITSGSGMWGSIGGLLSNQTDLQAALDAKQATLTFDTVPTDGSTNPVESNAVFDGLALRELLANKVTSWQATPDDTHYASEKLVKDSLDLKYDSADFSGDWDIILATKTTDDLTEGVFNLYDKQVAFTGGTNLTISGVYPNFIINDNTVRNTDFVAHVGDASHISENYTLPSADGTIGQILSTDGAGILSFIDSATTDHGGLTGLTDDDHVGYLLLAGRAGQTIDDDITLNGTLELPLTTFSASDKGIITKDGVRFIYDFNYGDNGTVTTVGDNLFMGIYSGNLTLGSTATIATEASFNLGVGSYSVNGLTTGFYNHGIGTSALRRVTTGNNNTGIGGKAGHNITAGNDNTVIGWEALGEGTTGNGNTAIGYVAGRYIDGTANPNALSSQGLYLGGLTKALYNGATNENVVGYDATGHGTNTFTFGAENIVGNYFTGSIETKGETSDDTKYTLKTTDSSDVVLFAVRNDGRLHGKHIDTEPQSQSTRFGISAGLAITSGISNTFLGREAGFSCTEGGSNVFVGFSAGWANTIGGECTGVGTNAGWSNVEGTQWAAFGRNAAKFNVSGDLFLAVGYAAARLNETGTQFTAVGSNAALNGIAGNYFVAVGNDAGFSAGGDNWVAVGYAAGANNLTGDDWTAIGKYAGRLTIAGDPITAGNSSIFIGYDSRGLDATSTNEVVIGTGAFGHGSNTITIGNLSTHHTYFTGEVNAKGRTTNDASFAFKAIDSAEDNLLSVRNDGLISFKNYTFPNLDGTANQMFKTDGNGVITFFSADLVPTDSSTNPVESNGVFDALDTKVNLAGLAGGQTIYGGTLTGEGINIYSNPLKDGISNIGDTVYVDEVNNRVGINNPNPTELLDLYGINARIKLFSENNKAATVHTENSSGQLFFGVDSISGNIVGSGTPYNRFVYSSGNYPYYTYVNGQNRRTILPNGDVGFSIVTPTARVHAKGSTNDSSAYAFRATDSLDADLFTVRNDGLVTITDYAMPNGDGNDENIITTNGAGVATWIDHASLQVSGEMYQVDNATETDINTAGQGVWVHVLNFTAGLTQRTSFASDSLTIGTNGGGKHPCAVSLTGISGAVGKTYEFAISVNDVIQTKTKQARYFSTTSDIGNISLHGILELVANDVVKLEMRGIDTDADFLVTTTNVMIH